MGQVLRCGRKEVHVKWTTLKKGRLGTGTSSMSTAENHESCGKNGKASYIGGERSELSYAHAGRRDTRREKRKIMPRIGATYSSRSQRGNPGP